MTLLVASAFADTPDELYAVARRAAETADWIEIRLDGPSGLPWDLRSFFSFGKPCIATMRHTLDGGRSGADDRMRADILRRAILGGARGIDVEAWSDEAATLTKEAHAHGIMVIVSHHLEETPTEDVLLAMLQEARAMGADHAKIATRVEKPEDALVLVRTAMRAREAGLPFALMAVNDPFLRILAPSLGLSLAYASVPGAQRATVGQLPSDALRAAWSLDRPTSRSPTSGATRAVFLLGHPVAHSRSPSMHNAGFAVTGIDASYLALDVAPANLSTTLQGLKTTNALGCNLTIPHKESALTWMDDVDASAREAGAVNTVVFRDGRAIGHNTDGYGALEALRESGVKLPQARTLILGAGGAARAIAHALHQAKADITITNRTPERGASLGFPTIPWERIGDVMRNVDLLINATSLGLHGESVPAPLEKMMPGAAVLDCVYGATPLLDAARAHGLFTVPGDAMLLHQGARAFELWTGRRAPIDVMRAALGASR